ncbi:uncharacterized protein LOC125491764 [Beta vulgaris subsp. vulgaris]|uniref:uncharacterized protein LOC125491764 n=1 Tax=Beta vulgaris subsp. vulgaris TaxID=3555 RepID=UPI00254722DE|nr:uncharacterized protein LOC125491764 [Beta vulgaris subsp. vulgaris]
MAAVGRDANDQMYPVAWAIMEGENNSSWEWFLTQVREALSLGEGDGLTIVSDEHLVILSSVKAVFPNCEHRHCARHIFAHWHKVHKGDDMKLMFWKAAKAYSLADYNEALAEMEAENPNAVTDFKAHNSKVFCRAFLDTTTKVDVITSNLSETFNGYIINARTKHLIYLLEDIRVGLMQRLVVKRQAMEGSSAQLCPRITSRLEKEKEWAANCTPIPSTNTVFQVNHGMDSLTVDLQARSCTCKKWDLTGIPCCHAVSCIFFCHKDAEDYVSGYYTRDIYLQSYGGSIPPVVGDRHWPKINSPLNPPQ